MKVMVLVKATKDSEAGIMPSQTLLAEMGKFNEELVKAGVLLAAEGLRPSAKGKRVQFSATTASLSAPDARPSCMALMSRFCTPLVRRSTASAT